MYNDQKIYYNIKNGFILQFTHKVISFLQFDIIERE